MLDPNSALYTKTLFTQKNTMMRIILDEAVNGAKSNQQWINLLRFPKYPYYNTADIWSLLQFCHAGYVKPCFRDYRKPPNNRQGDYLFKGLEWGAIDRGLTIIRWLTEYFLLLCACAFFRRLLLYVSTIFFVFCYPLVRFLQLHCQSDCTPNDQSIKAASVADFQVYFKPSLKLWPLVTV